MKAPKYHSDEKRNLQEISDWFAGLVAHDELNWALEKMRGEKNPKRMIKKLNYVLEQALPQYCNLVSASMRNGIGEFRDIEGLARIIKDY